MGSRRRQALPWAAAVVLAGLIGCGGDSYKTLTIGGKMWMNKNLNIQTENSWCYGEDGQVWNREQGKFLTLSDSEIQANCAKYGRLYTWKAAKSACSSAGSGWRLPTDADWQALADAVGEPKVAGKKLKTKKGWNRDNVGNISGNGTDKYGFSALPGGRRYPDGDFFNAGDFGNWWTATETGADIARFWNVGYNYPDTDDGDNSKNNAFSVRCVRDD
jgi:uncharacterized protein (TIGR02145 family)